MIIEEKDIQYSRLAAGDSCGRIFIYNGRLMRGIYAEHVDAVKEMFSSGLVCELIEKRMLPNTSVTDMQTDLYPLILEHEKIEVVSYGFEWTIHMYLDAASLIKDLVGILEKYGYILWDCHTDNILFDKGKPIYVDFGSFVKKEKSADGRVFPFDNYIKDYVRIPQMLTHRGDLTRYILKNTTIYSLLDFDNYYFGLKTNKFRMKLKEIMYKVKKKGTRCFKFYAVMRRNYLFGLTLRIIRNGAAKGRWSGYTSINENMLYGGNQDDLPDQRFRNVLDVIKSLDVSSVYEWGGNSGYFAILACKENKSISKYICSDFDDYSMDKLYEFIKKYGSEYGYLKKISPIVADFYDAVSLTEKNGAKRYQCDLVIALAITHHLLLAQYVDVDAMFEAMASYTKKYIIIEFMPLGLWGGGEEYPEVPKFYNLDWFKEHMECYFRIKEVRTLNKNRIMLFGEKI